MQEGDRLLLCSDGLSDLVPDALLADGLGDDRISRDQLVDNFVDQALSAGGRDNITVLVVDIVDAASADTGTHRETLEVPIVG